jgi:hypothetical protein
MRRDEKQHAGSHHDGAERDGEYYRPTHAGRFAAGLEVANASGGLRIKNSGFHPALKL